MHYNLLFILFYPKSLEKYFYTCSAKMVVINHVVDGIDGIDGIENIFDFIGVILYNYYNRWTDSDIYNDKKHKGEIAWK